MGPMTTAELDDQLIAALRERGQRVTLPRLLVHRHVREGRRHLTPEQIYDELAPELPSLSPATVYGTLDLLGELGFIRRVSTPGGRTTYDSRTDDHHHVVCTNCGRVQDLDASVDSAAAERAAREAGFEIAHAQVTLTGLCPDCAATAR
jgi:Fe2+ or Zn2+ uptake regulation protein